MQTTARSVKKLAASASRRTYNLFLSDTGIQVLCVSVFSVYVAATLKMTDLFLANHLAGYVYAGKYTVGMLIFIVSALVYLRFARWRQWHNWRYYILGAVVVFFPLVFLASVANFLILPDGALISSLRGTYCGTDYHDRICGQAFAALISSMSLRALPVVITTPAMFWFIFIRPLNSASVAT